MLIRFVEDDDVKMFDLVMEDAEPDTYEEIWMRSAVYLPAEMANVFLSECLTPRRALVKLSGLCNTTKNPGDFKILIDWLRVACMEDAKVAIQRGQNPTVTIMDDELVTRLLRTAKADLPDWNQQAQDTEEVPPTTPGLPNAGPPIEMWEHMFSGF
jgi:hypothetical protein